MANTILKWASGKRQIISEVIAAFPKGYKGRRFYEPMFVTGAVTFQIELESGAINCDGSRGVGELIVTNVPPNDRAVRF